MEVEKQEVSEFNQWLHQLIGQRIHEFKILSIPTKVLKQKYIDNNKNAGDILNTSNYNKNK